jgi:hypothetical protein
MPPITTLPNTNNISATLIRKELGYANTSGALDIDGTVRYMQPGIGKTINTTPGSAIAMSDLQGAYLRDYEEFWTYNANVIPRATGTDSLGNIIVGFEDSDNSQYILVKFNPTGNVIWASNISNTSAKIYPGGKILFDWSDNIYAKILVGNASSTTVNSSIISLYSNGSLRWNAQEDLGRPIPSGNVYSYNNNMEFNSSQTSGAYNPSQIFLAGNGIYKAYNTNNGTVNNGVTLTSTTFTNLNITTIWPYNPGSASRSFAGTASNTGGQNAFVADIQGNNPYYYENTQNFIYVNDMKNGYDPGSLSLATSYPQSRADMLLMSSSPSYPDNPKTAATSSKISIAIFNKPTVPAQDFMWDIDFGATRKVIGYKLLDVSNDFNYINVTGVYNEYFLIVGQIVANPSSIFVLAYGAGDPLLVRAGSTAAYIFPWCYEIASSNSSHDFEISGVPKSIVYDTKTKLLIPVKVSRSGSFIRNSVMSVSLPQISANTSTLSVSNEGTFGGVSIYPLNPTITKRKNANTISTSFTITSTTFTGAQGTGTTVCAVTPNNSFTTGTFNFIS